MKWIQSDDIKDWASRFDTKADFPIYLGRLIRATTPNDTFLEFPGGSAVFSGGWDGKVICSKSTSYVPEGISLWELGTEAKVSKKADDDYSKRCLDSLGYDTSECTFVFATPRFWKDKDAWRLKRVAEKKWREVKVYDCINLAEWFDEAPAVAYKFAIDSKNYPGDGIQTTEDFWKEWSVGPKILPFELLVTGREKEFESLKYFLENKTAGIRAVQASSREEAIAFIIACAKKFEIQSSENFFSKSLIIDTANNFRTISNNQSSLVLISRFEEIQILYRGVSDGHHVLLPMGADDNFNGDRTILPIIDRNGMIDCLIKSGTPPEEAEKLALESGRDITILKRLMEFPTNKIAWADRQYAKDLIPALLLGRWDESKKGDKEVLTMLSGEEYDGYVEKISRWKYSENPFIYQIGTTWRLVSPLDAWSNLIPFINKKELDNFKSVFSIVLSNVRPAFDLEPEKRLMANLYGKDAVHSDWACEGLVQSLILIALYGSRLRIDLSTTSQFWVDAIVRQLLQNADGKLWASLNRVMPLIAEASPQSFIDEVNNSIKEQKPAIMAMFEEEPAFLTPRSFHTGLLWALESLAWLPGYLSQVGLILAKLSILDPGGRLSNRPKNSLRSIFLPWMPQTFADINERKEALLLLKKNHPDTIWNLILSLLPKSHDVAQPTHKTRWRLFGENREFNNITLGELLENQKMLVDLLLSFSEINESKIAALIETSDTLSPTERAKILNYVNINSEKIDQEKFDAWHALRKTLYHHRSFPDSEWSLPETELELYQKLYEKLQPLDLIERYKWLFEEQWPQFVEGQNHTIVSDDNYQKKIDYQRKKGLSVILKAFGIEKVNELSAIVKEKWILGETLAIILSDDIDILPFLTEEKLLDEIEVFAARGFIYKLDKLKGTDSCLELFRILLKKGYSFKALASFLVPLPQNQNLWNFISSCNAKIENAYWGTASIFFRDLPIDTKLFALNKLLSANRPIAAINAGFRFVEDIPNDLIIRILRSAINSDEHISFPDYEVEKIFDELYKKTDFDRTQLAQLEWSYLNILTRGYNQIKNLVIYDDLVNNPSVFVEFLKWIYKPPIDDVKEQELNEIDLDTRVKRAQHAYQLLSSWHTVPGDEGNNIINAEKLTQWVNAARIMAAAADRADAADIEIGKMLAKYPENIQSQWPPDVICEIIDTINSDIINRNFRSGIFNKRGFSSRAPFEGGTRERKLAEYFTDLYEKIYTKWPITASILQSLADQYEFDAKVEDERAKRDSLDY